MLARFALMGFGLPAVGFSLVADGAYRTPRIWRLWANSAAGTPAWHVPPKASYALPVIMIVTAWYSMPRWHELWTIYFIFTALAQSLIVFDKDRWNLYWWNAVRNPTPGLADMLEQPIREVQPNPDRIVRAGTADSAHRWMASGIFWEYWYLRRVSDDKYFEFRIGWKFVDGNAEFFPAIQFRIGD